LNYFLLTWTLNYVEILSKVGNFEMKLIYKINNHHFPDIHIQIFENRYLNSQFWVLKQFKNTFSKWFSLIQRNEKCFPMIYNVIISKIANLFLGISVLLFSVMKKFKRSHRWTFSIATKVFEKEKYLKEKLIVFNWKIQFGDHISFNLIFNSKINHQNIDTQRFSNVW
jgi:hypothetical protein